MIELYWILEIRKNKVLKVLTELRDEVSRVFDDSCYTKEQLGADKCKESTFCNQYIVYGKSSLEGLPSM